MKYIAKSKLLKLDDLIYLQKWTCLDQSSWLGHNVCRIYDTDAFDDFDPYQVVRCCNLEVFKPKVVTDSLLPENKHVFVSVIENCFEDCLSEVEIVEVGEDGAAAKIENDKRQMAAVDNMIEQVTTIMKTMAESNTDSRLLQLCHARQ